MFNAQALCQRFRLKAGCRCDDGERVALCLVRPDNGLDLRKNPFMFFNEADMASSKFPIFRA